VLGSSAKGILTSGDALEDRKERREFSELSAQKHHIEHSSMNDSLAVLLVGDQDWPFPVPLVRTGQQWQFNPDKGAIEVRARRIGADELDVIEICTGYVAAQDEYETQGRSGTADHAYAQQIMSSPGTNNGLYQAGASQALVPEGLAMAAANSPGGIRKPYHGYSRGFR
jgi:hypothetical protein